MSEELPYGFWTCADGREVLFNRKYKPIWERQSGGTARRANPGEWVPFVKQSWFFNDASPPWDSPETRRRCSAVLVEWGLA